MVRQTRNTRQKQQLSNAITSLQGFFDADELYEHVKHHKISKATIYRYLRQAQEDKELYAYACGNKQLFSKGKKSHCHFTCEKTGKVIHFDIDSIDFLKDKIPGTITSFQLEVKGVCTHCDEH